jgi:hypothetical protein
MAQTRQSQVLISQVQKIWYLPPLACYFDSFGLRVETYEKEPIPITSVKMGNGMQIRIFVNCWHIPKNFIILQLPPVQRFSWTVVRRHIHLSHIETRKWIYPPSSLFNLPPATTISLKIYTFGVIWKLTKANLLQDIRASPQAPCPLARHRTFFLY